MKYFILLILLIPLTGCAKSLAVQEFDTYESLRDTSKVSNDSKALQFKKGVSKECFEEYKFAKGGASKYCKNIKVYKNIEGGYFVEQELINPKRKRITIFNEDQTITRANIYTTIKNGNTITTTTIRRIQEEKGE